ncbi:MAG: aromatic ring-hydroxylating dioxygenase subunit alpha [Planctomycetes bacterium]|nr:aromatic ring-hydroxylating dioxygenase subunit alpha [Planctomycetota bacterium]
MPSFTVQEKRDLAALVASRQPGHGLPGGFYSNDTVYRAEMENIWRRGWLFVGHTCEIAKPGDYVTFAVGNDSLIVIRGDDGRINALWNVCRHRGTQICSEPRGRAGRLVCPYHQWTYARDGSLVSCRGMQEDIDKSQLGLLRAQVREVAGLIYVSLSDNPPDFEQAAEAIEPFARPQGLDRAKVAKIVDYDVAANWKIVWENNRECYHCNVNHPQYIKANFDHYNADDTSERVSARISQAVARSEEKWAAAGLAVSHRQSGMAQFPDAERNCWYSVNRTPLVEGYVSETMDGRQVAPLMGDYSDADVGTLRIRTLPNMWLHASCDHAVTTRLLPTGLQRTAVRVTWLVHRDAVEGRDYRLADIVPFWQLTSEQDWALCGQAQKGVNSSHYVPGPFSTYKEYNVDSFVRWCLQQLSREQGAGGRE